MLQIDRFSYHICFFKYRCFYWTPLVAMAQNKWCMRNYVTLYCEICSIAGERLSCILQWLKLLVYQLGHFSARRLNHENLLPWVSMGKPYNFSGRSRYFERGVLLCWVKLSQKLRAKKKKVFNFYNPFFPTCFSHAIFLIKRL